jgi:hypothetical protein
MMFATLDVDRLAILAMFATYFSPLSFAAPTPQGIPVVTPVLGGVVCLLQPYLPACKQQSAAPVLMGLAKSFGALSATTLTSIGNTAITGAPAGAVGDGGVYPGTSITGFPPGTASGVLSAGTVFSQNGEAACLLAYNKYVSSFDVSKPNAR